MHPSSKNYERLNPRKLLDYLKRKILKEKREILDEVLIRRIISAIYFSLFNYWSIKRYSQGKRCGGPYGDSFWYSTFNQEMFERGLDRAMYIIYLYRVAADHYALNPTKVRLTSHPWKDEEENVEINEHILHRILEASYEILRELEQ